MPYELIWNDRSVIFKYAGQMNSADVLESNQAVYSDPRFDDLLWQIVDLDAVDSFTFSEKHIKQLAYIDKAAFRTNPRITVVFAGESELIRKLFKMYDSYSSGESWPVYQRPSFEEALAFTKPDELDH